MTITVTEPVAQGSITATSIPEHPDSPRKGVSQSSSLARYVLSLKETFLKIVPEEKIRLYYWNGYESGYERAYYVLLVELGDYTFGETYTSANNSSWTHRIWMGSHLDDGAPIPAGSSTFNSNYTSTSTMPTSLSSQIVYDSDNDTYYLLTFDPLRIGYPHLKMMWGPLAEGKYCFIMLHDFIFTSDVEKQYTHGLVISEETRALCSCMPCIPFHRYGVLYNPSGSLSTEVKYVSGVMIYKLPGSNPTQSSPYMLSLPPSRLGKLASYISLTVGTRFNNYNYILIDSNTIIPWSGDPESVFVGDI